MMETAPHADKNAAPFQDALAADGPDGPAHVFFARRDDLEQLDSRLDRHEGNIVLVTGSGGVGKTSLLRQMERRCGARGDHVAWLDFNEIVPRITSDEAFYFQIVKALLSDKKFRHFKDRLIRKKGAWKTRLAALVRACAKQAASGRLVVLCDDCHLLADPLAEGGLSASALEWISEIDCGLQKGRVCFVMAGDLDMKTALGEDFFQGRLEYKIPLFSEKRAWDLIAGALKGEYAIQDPGLISMIYTLSGGHPLYIRHICDALDAGERRRPVIGRRDLMAAADGIIEKPFYHMLKSWHRLSWKNRAVLSALAARVPAPGAYVPMADIRRAIKKGRYDLTPADFSQAAADLVGADLVDYDPEENALRFNSDLLRQWIVLRRKNGTELDRRGTGGRAGRLRPRIWKLAAAATAIGALVSGFVLFSDHIVNAKAPGTGPEIEISRAAR